jgi:DNA-directed RNA polymerase subunit RPC12/RpoP
MKKNRRDRMAKPQNRARGRPRSDEGQFDAQPCVPDDVRLVCRCPRCGAARVLQWETYRSDERGQYRRCRACGIRAVFSRDGRVRVIR